jgi:PIN domain nuclease of toxin-antitoxin system
MMEILDASALLALFNDEKGSLKVKELLVDAEGKKYSVFMHQINFIEVVNKCVRLVGESETKKILANLDEQVVGISNYMNGDLAGIATKIKTLYAISLADAIGLAFTKVMSGRFWTADKALGPIAENEKIRIKLIR